MSDSQDKQEETKGFKVNDKRLFDEEGKARDEAPQQAEETAASAEPNFTSSDVTSSAEEPPEINFASFVASLATQALMQLGEMPAPAGMEIPTDKMAAKQTIDILSMLKDKTVGNLDEQENYFLEETLHSLRLAFLKT